MSDVQPVPAPAPARDPVIDAIEAIKADIKAIESKLSSEIAKIHGIFAAHDKKFGTQLSK